MSKKAKKSEVVVSVNGELQDPNQPTTSTSTAVTPEVENDKEPEAIQPEAEEKQSVSEVDHSYANELAARIRQAGKISSVKIVGVAEEDFDKLQAANLIISGAYLKGSAQVIVIYKGADVTGTFWDRTNQ